MKLMYMFLCLELYLVAVSGGNFILEALGRTLHSTGTFLYKVGATAVCGFVECCNEGWISRNFTHLKRELDTKLFGQPLVKDIVVKALKAHISNPEPKKALVLSFHGWTGSGKTFVANFITESFYWKGSRSKYAHYFVGPVHFQLMRDADIYRLHLQDWIRGNVSNCENSLFVFDEADKIPQKVLDGIKPFIDYHNHISGVNYRKSIFIFLSNTGGSLLTEKMYEFWKAGKKRDQLTLADFSELLEKGAFNEEGGLHHSDVIGSQLVNYYVPFLPLEKQHVKLCAQDAFHFRRYRPSNEMLQKVVDAMIYDPPDSPLYSRTGCKRVQSKVDMLIEEERYDEHDEM